MNGPYSYVTPNYWYLDDERGGAFGFNTETGPGIQPSPLESVKRMIPPGHLWPIDSIWEYHLGRNEFRTFRFWMNPFNSRYGKAEGIEEFTYKAQMSNYEAMRAMFEAFVVNQPNATGIIQWMLNSAWPGMLWQLYDWYLMPNGAFYGAKTGCRPLNLIYNYKDKDIYLSNDYYESFENLKAEIRVLDINSREVLFEDLEVGIGQYETLKIYDMPVMTGLTTTYFMDLRLKDDQDNLLNSNFYWLSTRDDVLDFENSEWFITPNRSYSDLTGINGMAESELNVDHEFMEQGDTLRVRARLENTTGRLAFFIQLILTGKESVSSILPVFWEDNYVSLLPGEAREISGYVFRKDLGGDEPVFSYKGWNVKSN
jgi:exo-1,4-beta-D-glucosaminidase